MVLVKVSQRNNVFHCHTFEKEKEVPCSLRGGDVCPYSLCRQIAMQNQNISDLIEAYLKKVMSEREQIEIRRNEIAELFDCVPSQINYVINTRFTIQQGYLVESKRGGGGYIRINKVQLLDEMEILDTMVDIIGDSITERSARSIIQKLYEEDVVSKREAKLMLVSMDKSLFSSAGNLENKIRAKLLVTFLNNLKYE